MSDSMSATLDCDKCDAGEHSGEFSCMRFSVVACASGGGLAGMNMSNPCLCFAVAGLVFSALWSMYVDHQAGYVIVVFNGNTGETDSISHLNARDTCQGLLRRVNLAP